MAQAMILCDDVKCSDPGHIIEAIERLYKDIVKVTA